MTRRLLVATVAWLVATPASATAPWAKSGIPDWTKVPSPAAEPTFHAPTPTRTRLANGMSVVVVPNHRLPLVSMALVVPWAGSAADPRGKAGLAAFTADLLDEGAGGLSALAISDELDRLGASTSLSVHADETVLFASTLAKTLDPTIELWTKIITAPAFDDGEVTRVHGDRVTALRLRPDRPREVAGLVLANALYGRDTAYGHPSAGYVEDVTKLGAKDARAFYAKVFQPERMVLVVSGDVEPAALAAKLEATLGAWKPKVSRTPIRPQVTARPVRSRLLVIDRAKAEQSDVRIGTIAIPRTDPRYFPLEVASTVLGGGFTSRLVQRLREQLGYTYGISSSASYSHRTGTVTIGSAIFTPKTVDALKEVQALVGGLAKEDVPAPELTKAKQNLTRALPQAFETNDGIANAFSELAIFSLPDDWYDRYAGEIDKVGAKDVREVAASLFPTGKLVYVVVGDVSAVGKGLEELRLGKATFFLPDGAPKPGR